MKNTIDLNSYTHLRNEVLHLLQEGMDRAKRALSRRPCEPTGGSGSFFTITSCRTGTVPATGKASWSSLPGMSVLARVCCIRSWLSIGLTQFSTRVENWVGVTTEFY